MTTTAAGADAEHSAPGEPPRPRRRRTWIVPATGLIAALMGGLWWHTHPTSFASPADEVGAFPETLQPVYIGSGWHPSGEPWGDVRVRDAQARVEVFGAAEVEVVMCREPVGVLYQEDIGSSCGPIDTADDAEWTTLAVRVDSDEPGTVVVLRGIDVTYSNDLQRGTQHTGVRGVVVFPHEEP